MCCDLIELCLLIHSTILFSKVNKDPVYQTDVHFLKRLNSFKKDFEIQFTPLMYFSQNSFLQEVLEKVWGWKELQVFLLRQ